MACVILLSASACDNVEWGGVDMRLEPPPPVTPRAAADPAEDPAIVEEPELPPLPAGPVLYMGSRTGARVSIRPVAEISGDSLIPLLTDADAPGYEAYLTRSLMGPGTRFTLFAGGVRVGTVRSDTTFVEGGFCSTRPLAEGIAELVPGAASATRFIALPAEVADDRPYDTYRSPDHTYEQRVASIEMANAALVLNEGVWPESVLETRVDMQAVPLDGEPLGGMAATFLYRDRLAVGPAESPDSWAIFVLGQGGPQSWERVFTWYREPGDGTKAAPRLWETADWDGDGESEVLLQVFGESARWSAALDRRGGSWTAVFEEDCGTPAGSP